MTDVLQPSPATGPSTPTSPQSAMQPEPALRDANGSASTWPPGLPTRMTWEEYLAWDFEDIDAEWVDGEIVIMPPVRADHQFIAGFLYRLICDFAERYGLGLVLQPPMRMHLSSRPSGREPDVLFLAAEHADRLKDAIVVGPADLAVEVISPESEERDRAIKFVEYETAGVAEYWAIDGLRREAYFYVLGEDGHYHLAIVPSDGIYRPHVLEGLRLKVNWLWRVPNLTMEKALAELAD